VSVCVSVCERQRGCVGVCFRVFVCERIGERRVCERAQKEAFVCVSVWHVCVCVCLCLCVRVCV